MATASKGDVTTIQLSQEEAETLCVVLRKIGGSPETTRRGFTDNIYQALRTIGFDKDYNTMKGYEMNGSLEFPKR
jgi:hypothetical protein